VASLPQCKDALGGNAWQETMQNLRKEHSTRLLALGTLTLGLTLLCTQRFVTAGPTASQALQLSPVQSGIDFDQPTAADAETCKIDSIDEDDLSGWEVKTADGALLRRFLDTNQDKKVDRWCYFKDGIEVYRDIDINFNGKADQYRWLGTAGMRWGIDGDEDGSIDSWKEISPEEVTEEVVAALVSADQKRFDRLLLTKAELGKLGLGSRLEKNLGDSITKASDEFQKVATSQKRVDNSTRWLGIAAGKPGAVPAGTDDSISDIVVYENVAAIVETGDKTAQLPVGTLIKIGDVWRLANLPAAIADPEMVAAEGFFFQSPLNRPAGVNVNVAAGEQPADIQKLLTRFEDIDRQMQSATGTKLAALHGDRADLMLELADRVATDADRANWIRQFSDTVAAATQSGEYDGGLAKLAAVAKTIDDEDLSAYVQFRYLSTGYAVDLQAEDADFAKIQESWLDNLEDFVKKYPSSPDASEALLQLAIAAEFSGDTKEALSNHRKIVTDFADLPVAAKATGAIRRLESEGKSLELAGSTIDGGKWTIRNERGKFVVIHYWATWCEPCKQDMITLSTLRRSYGRNLEIIGVNVDSDRTAAAKYVRDQQISWPQLFEEGGLDNRLAVELGVFTLPTMILVDDKGKVISRNIHIDQLETELEKELK
jgi:thiol-disulfide isomerase/thioredoxin